MWTFLSHYLNNETPTYGNYDSINITKASCIDHGDSSNGLNLNMSNHVGTHMDLPNHFHSSGKKLNDYSADEWFFKNVQLIDRNFEPEHVIQINDLTDLSIETDFLILRTGFESYRDEELYWNNNPGFAEDVGRYLRKNFPNLKVVGFDFISITGFQNRPLGRKAHYSFLGEYEGLEALRVIEDMKLAHLEKAPSEVIIAPLMLDNADGMQVTVFAKS